MKAKIIAFGICFVLMNGFMNLSLSRAILAANAHQTYRELHTENYEEREVTMINAYVSQANQTLRLQVSVNSVVVNFMVRGKNYPIVQDKIAWILSVDHLYINFVSTALVNNGYVDLVGIHTNTTVFLSPSFGNSQLMEYYTDIQERRKLESIIFMILGGVMLISSFALFVITNNSYKKKEIPVIPASI